MLNFKKHLSNIIGWSTSRKIVILESDDWGSIRMPSKKTREHLERNGLDLRSRVADVYNTYDTLANADDFNALFEVFQKYKGARGETAVFTALSLVANPDFAKIKQHDFSDYFWEPLAVTLDRYYPDLNVLNLWKEGIDKKLFVPQFHGREHLNIRQWMTALQQKDVETRLAFDQGCWGFVNKNQNGINYQAAFDLEKMEDLHLQEIIIRDGLSLFEKIFGYRATFFVPPNGPINNNLEKVAFENGVKYISTSKIQKEALGRGKTRIRLHYLGQKNSWNQIYTTRNCFFEPALKGKDWVASCLNDIESAFFFLKPAIVSSHRVNYIGALDEKNRANGLTQLDSLLKTIVRRWPDVEFMTSHELGDLISGRKS